MRKTMRRVICIVMLFLMCTNIFASATNATNWALPAMIFGNENGFVSDELMQNAKSPITRIEFSQMSVRFYKFMTNSEVKAKNQSPFLDTKDEEVTLAYELGIVNGMTSTQFSPWSQITREQMAIMTVKTLKACNIDLKANDIKTNLKDISNLSETSRGSVTTLFMAGIVSGENNKFFPKRAATVQEAASVFYRSYEKSVGIEPVPQVEPTKESEIKGEKNTIMIGDKSITLLDSVDSLIKTWGNPTRIDKNEFAMDRYVYADDYETFFMVSIKNEKIVEIYTNSDKFIFQGINGSGKIKDIKDIKYLDKRNYRCELNLMDSDGYILYDNASNIDGILLQEKNYGEGLNRRYDDKFKNYMTLELMDLMNSVRVKDGQKALTLDEAASKNARYHSEDMSKYDYLAYQNKDGKTPFERMQDYGINFSMAAENVAKIDGDAIKIYHHWMTNIGTKSNIVNSAFTYVGIGIFFDNYTVYMTADFFSR